MEQLKPIVSMLLGFVLTVSLGGCVMSDEVYFNNEDEAKQVMISRLEEKYGKKFTPTGRQKYEYDEREACDVMYLEFQDEEGYKADAKLLQTKEYVQRMLNSGRLLLGLNEDDTYCGVYYTRKAIDAAEPLFETMPFEDYIISVHNPHWPKNDLSLTLDEFFQRPEVYYWFDIILPPDKTREEYAQMIFDFYQRAFDEQIAPFAMSCYANGVQIISTPIAYPEGPNRHESTEYFYSRIDMQSKQELVKPKYLTWDYYLRKGWGYNCYGDEDEQTKRYHPTD